VRSFQLPEANRAQTFTHRIFNALGGALALGW
jgi:hypothetical protein